jgi:OOP family OmpA-OmpF porin
MSKLGRILACSAGCVLLMTSIATAEVEKVRLEVSPYAGALLVDEQLGYTESVAPMVGAKLGIALAPRVLLEAQASWARFQTNGTSGLEDRDLGMLSGGLSIDLLGGSHVRPFLTLGGGYAEDITTDALGSVADPFAEVGGGFKITAGGGLGIRLEARQIMMPREGVSGTELLQNTAVGMRLVLPFARQHGDQDTDGIRDNKDLCSATPVGADVDLQGCPVDSDSDGVWDGIDVCMSTPVGAAVDGSGCPTDSDGDGVYDGIDVCMSTPAGAMVDGSGCPTDTDGDGILDGMDNCPNSAAGARVDDSGCEISAMEYEMLDTGRVRVNGGEFASGKAEQHTTSYSVVDEAGEVLSRWSQLTVEIGGHTDSKGKASSNRSLSERRAQAVADYILWRFPQVSSNQIRVRGYGEEQPVSTNSTVEGRQKNRRVELLVLNREELRQMRN